MFERQVIHRAGTLSIVGLAVFCVADEPRCWSPLFAEDESVRAPTTATTRSTSAHDERALAGASWKICGIRAAIGDMHVGVKGLIDETIY